VTLPLFAHMTGEQHEIVVAAVAAAVADDRVRAAERAV
jgi:hypothetical protein